MKSFVLIHRCPLPLLPLHGLAWMLAFSLPIALSPTASRAQAPDNQDTRLRLDQQFDGTRRTREDELLEEADDLQPPSTLEIDGQTYSVEDNVNDMGKALYIAITRKRWTLVKRFLAAYERYAERDPMLVLYARGALARQRGKLGLAEHHYRELLALQPDFLPARLELARTLFENRKDTAARRMFEAIAASLTHQGERASGVRRNVAIFLKALQRRRSWQATLAIGPTYSTNLNQSSASYTCLLEDTEGNCLFERQVPDPIAAPGINFEATLGRELPLAGHHAVHMRTLAYGDIFPAHHAYSQATVNTRLGYRYQSARDTLILAPSIELASLGSSMLYMAPGANAEWTHAFSSKVSTRLEANIRDFDYRKAYQALNGTLSDMALTTWYSPSPGWTVFGGPDMAYKSAPSRADSYWQSGARIGLNKAFGGIANLLLLGSLRHRQYRAYSAVLEGTRRDRQFNVTAVTQLPSLSVAGLTPEVVLRHTRVQSSIDWLYSYARTSLTLRVSHAF